MTIPSHYYSTCYLSFAFSLHHALHHSMLFHDVHYHGTLKYLLHRTVPYCPSPPQTPPFLLSLYQNAVLGGRVSWDKNEYGAKTGKGRGRGMGAEIGTRVGVGAGAAHLTPVTTPNPVPVPLALRDSFSYSYTTPRTAASLSLSSSAMNYRHRPRSATFTAASMRPPGTSISPGIIILKLHSLSNETITNRIILVIIFLLNILCVTLEVKICSQLSISCTAPHEI